jgi:hypothetical protein
MEDVLPQDASAEDLQVDAGLTFLDEYVKAALRVRMMSSTVSAMHSSI